MHFFTENIFELIHNKNVMYPGLASLTSLVTTESILLYTTRHRTRSNGMYNHMHLCAPPVRYSPASRSIILNIWRVAKWFRENTFAVMVNIFSHHLVQTNSSSGKIVEPIQLLFSNEFLSDDCWWLNKITQRFPTRSHGSTDRPTLPMTTRGRAYQPDQTSTKSISTTIKPE